MSTKKIDYNHEHFKEWDFYVTGGRRAGRILACRKPFHRGDGVYRQSMDLKDWKILGDKKLTETELNSYLEEINAANIAALRETVQRHKPEGYELLESENGFFRIVIREN
jgi:hypothetical protein